MKNEVKAAMTNKVKAARKKDIIKACRFYLFFRNVKRTRTKMDVIKEVATTLAKKFLSLQAEVASLTAEMQYLRISLATLEWQHRSKNAECNRRLAEINEIIENDEKKIAEIEYKQKINEIIETTIGAELNRTKARMAEIDVLLELNSAKARMVEEKLKDKVKAGNEDKLEAGNVVKDKLEAGDKIILEAGSKDKLETGNKDKDKAGDKDMLEGGNKDTLEAANMDKLEAGTIAMDEDSQQDVTAEQFKKAQSSLVEAAFARG